MAVPAPVLTINPNSVDRTYQDLAPQVLMSDTNTPTPAASGREFQFDTATVVATTGATGVGVKTDVPYKVNLAAGARAGRVQTTNADGTGTSANVTLTVTDAIASAADLHTDDNNLTVRVHPDNLVNEYKDPTIATPGLPTASGVYNGRRRGTVS